MSSEIVNPADALIASGESWESIGRGVADIAFRHPGWRRWWIAFAGALGLLGMLVIVGGVVVSVGVGVWGNNIPVTWALDIVSYDWWMGVACGGLIVSAMLQLTGVEWRSSISRIAETVALFAACAGAIYPIIHLGRPWFFYWTLPYVNSMLLWPQFRSPLYWDAVDIISFLGIAASFWYVGMVPDLATLRDRAAEQVRVSGGRGMLRARIYGIAALGWRGSAIHWARWTRAYRILALFGVVVSMTLQAGAAVMFAGTVEPGWHDTLLPVSFLMAALFAGVGVVVTVIVVLRSVFALDALITVLHLDTLGRLLLALGVLNLYCYVTEFFVTSLTGDSYELETLGRRAEGPHAWAFWLIVACALVPVHLFWIGRLRRSPLLLFIIGVLVAVGMWGDHFMVIVDTLQWDFLPSSAHPYRIGIYAVATFAGSMGLFLVLLLLFLRYFPAVSIMQTRPLAPLVERPRRGPVAVKEDDAPLWGISGEFGSAAAMVAALSALGKRGLYRLDAYSPLPVPAAEAALGLRPLRMGVVGAVGVALGFGFMLSLCTYATVWDYVFDIGGRPRFSWPYFIIPSVSFGMLGGAVAVLLALLLLNRLPRLNHPAFNIPGFGSSTQDRFFVVVEARKDGFNAAEVEQAFRSLEAAPLAVARVKR